MNESRVTADAELQWRDIQRRSSTNRKPSSDSPRRSSEAIGSSSTRELWHRCRASSADLRRLLRAQPTAAGTLSIFVRSASSYLYGAILEHDQRRCTRRVSCTIRDRVACCRHPPAARSSPSSPSVPISTARHRSRHPRPPCLRFREYRFREIPFREYRLREYRLREYRLRERQR